VSIKVVDVDEVDERASVAKSSSKSSESNSKLYYISSLSLLSNELRGEESSN